MDSRLGFPGLRRNDLTAFKRLFRIFHAEDRLYISLITANNNSTTTRVSSSESGMSWHRLASSLGASCGGASLGSDDVPGFSPTTASSLAEPGSAVSGFGTCLKSFGAVSPSCALSDSHVSSVEGG